MNDAFFSLFRSRKIRPTHRVVHLRWKSAAQMDGCQSAGVRARGASSGRIRSTENFEYSPNTHTQTNAHFKIAQHKAIQSMSRHEL